MALIRRGTASVTDCPDRAGWAVVKVAGVEWTLNAPESPVTSKIVVGRYQIGYLQHILLDTLEGDSQFITHDIAVEVITRDGDAFAVLTFDQARELVAALNAWLDSGSLR